jgi:hypothetical protein
LTTADLSGEVAGLRLLHEHYPEADPAVVVHEDGTYHLTSPELDATDDLVELQGIAAGLLHRMRATVLLKTGSYPAVSTTGFLRSNDRTLLNPCVAPAALGRVMLSPRLRIGKCLTPNATQSILDTARVLNDRHRQADHLSQPEHWTYRVLNRLGGGDISLLNLFAALEDVQASNPGKFFTFTNPADYNSFRHAVNTPSVFPASGRHGGSDRQNLPPPDNPPTHDQAREYALAIINEWFRVLYHEANHPASSKSSAPRRVTLGRPAPPASSP